MRRTMMFGLACMALISTAYVQTRDDFTGGFSPSLRWSWKLPGNNPLCTFDPNDPTAVSFTSNELVIQMRDGGMFSSVNAHRNVPSLTVTGSIPNNWYIETSFRIDWTPIGVDYYVQAGIVIFTSAQNYFQVLVTRDAFNQTTNVYGSTNLEENDSFEWGRRVTNPWAPDSDFIGLRIAHNPTDNTIELYFRHSGTGGWRLFDGFNGAVYPSGSRQYTFIQQLLSTPGVKIGVYTDNAGGGYRDPFYFDYFETNLSVAPAGDVNADGCVDDADLLAVLFRFGNTGDCLDEDVNLDGTVDDADLLTVLFNFGSGC
ncbi:MAG: hypothetical protein ABDI19_02015 [Armatimonadota bacterium]